MQRRDADDFVSVGEVFSAGPVLIAKDLNPAGAHHFTQLKQVDMLLTAAEVDPDLGFMVRLLTLCTLPRTNPGNRLQYVRHNGRYTLAMIAGAQNKLPFGNLPRLLLAWVCTEAVRTQSREIVLGASLSEFMRKLGLAPGGGGTTGSRTRLRHQMDRLFHAQVSLIYEEAGRKESASSLVADRIKLWWDERKPDEPVLWDSKIRLGEEFFNEIIRCPVPLDMNTLKALKRSSLGLDLYMWLTYRTFGLKRPLRLSWARLYRQFGADPAKADNPITVRNFRTDCLRELTKIKVAWPALDYATRRGSLEIRPSVPKIVPKS